MLPAMQQVLLYSDTNTFLLSYPCPKKGGDAGNKCKEGHDVWPSTNLGLARDHPPYSL